jgi:hypothetical protein
MCIGLSIIFLNVGQELALQICMLSVNVYTPIDSVYIGN